MKAHLSNPHDVAKQFPITDRLPDWLFRITERSAGVYYAEGIDLRGRRVSSEGTDADRVLAESVAMAQGISKAAL
jgi:hypothetical protein